MWGLAEHGGADDRGALSEASLGVARAGGESPGEEEPNSRPQTAVFSVAVAGSRRVRRFPLARVRLLVMESPPAALKREVGQLLVGMASSFAVVGSEPHLNELFAGLVGLG